MPQAAELAQHERPQFADARIDTQGIGRSLMFAVDAGISGAHPYDHVGGKFGAFIANCSYANGLWTTTDLASGIQFPHTKQLEQLTTKLTLVVWALLTNAGSYARLIEQPYQTTGATSAPFVSWFFGTDSGIGKGAAAYGAGATFTEADTIATNYYAATTVITQYAMTMDLVAGTVNFYLGGVPFGTVVSIATGSFDQGQKAPLNLLFDAGVGGGSPNSGTQSSMRRAFAFNTIATAAQIASLNLNPYQIWQSPRRSWQFGVSTSTPTLPPTGIRVNQAVNRSNTY